MTISWRALFAALAACLCGAAPHTTAVAEVASTVSNPKGSANSTASQASAPIGPSPQEERMLQNVSQPSGWLSPVNDQEHRLFTLVDVLEYRPSTGGGESQ